MLVSFNSVWEKVKRKDYRTTHIHQSDLQLMSRLPSTSRHFRFERLLSFAEIWQNETRFLRLWQGTCIEWGKQELVARTFRWGYILHRIPFKVPVSISADAANHPSNFILSSGTFHIILPVSHHILPCLFNIYSTRIDSFAPAESLVTLVLDWHESRVAWSNYSTNLFPSGECIPTLCGAGGVNAALRYTINRCQHFHDFISTCLVPTIKAQHRQYHTIYH